MTSLLQDGYGLCPGEVLFSSEAEVEPMPKEYLKLEQAEPVCPADHVCHPSNTDLRVDGTLTITKEHIEYRPEIDGYEYGVSEDEHKAKYEHWIDLTTRCCDLYRSEEGKHRNMYGVLTHETTNYGQYGKFDTPYGSFGRDVSVCPAGCGPCSQDYDCREGEHCKIGLPEDSIYTLEKYPNWEKMVYGKCLESVILTNRQLRGPTHVYTVLFSLRVSCPLVKFQYYF